MAQALVAVGSVEEIRAAGCKVVPIGPVPVLVLWHEGSFHAVDNRCPHMGFPLHRGEVHDGLLDCHWHHARFDVSCGATLDPWADDVDCYRVEVRDGRVWVDPSRPPKDPRLHGLARIGRGLNENLRLVLAKAAIEMEAGGVPVTEAWGAGARFGATEHTRGWRSGLTILGAMANVVDDLESEDRRRAVTKALAWIAEECEQMPPRRPLPGLEGTGRTAAGLRQWLRETVEVRDAEGAERVLRALIEHHGPKAAFDAVAAACTDHRYCDGGHTLDFAVKCAELAERFPEDAELQALLFTSLVPQLVTMERMEETSAWRRPVDVASLVAGYAEELPEARLDGGEPLDDEPELVDLFLRDDPDRSLRAVVERLRSGTHPVALADAVVAAATRRILHFGTVNEVPDWETVHHTQTYANAVAEGLRRVPSRELFRGVLDGVASIYLDRFLNQPPVPLPEAAGAPDDALLQLLQLYDRRASVDEVAELAWSFLEAGGAPMELFRTLGHAVLREDAGFHSYQQIDIAWRQMQRRTDTSPCLTATARWLAAHYPTVRAQEQTYSIAARLHRGEPLHELGQ